MAARHASQCGFCTPGFVMSLWARPEGAATDRQALEDRLAGNLCRCTGYGPILEAARPRRPRPMRARDHAADDALAASLRAIGPLDMKVGGHRVIVPHDEASFAAAVADHPDARIIAGATDVGLWITKKLYDPAVAIFAGEVRELKAIAVEGDELVVGAAVTHETFARTVAPMAPVAGRDDAPVRRAPGAQRRHGRRQHRQRLAHRRPAAGDDRRRGDALHRRSAGSHRTMPLEDYFIDYGEQAREPGEYVRALHVPARRARAAHLPQGLQAVRQRHFGGPRRLRAVARRWSS